MDGAILISFITSAAGEKSRRKNVKTATYDDLVYSFTGKSPYWDKKLSFERGKGFY